jgi:HlyD family secretion protein
LVLAVAGIAVVAVFGLVAARRGGREIDPSRLAAVERGDLARSVVATGKVQPLTKVEIKSKASGIVKRLFVDYGDTVEQGQVLAELDREQLEAAVREAKANLLAAEAAWERNRIEAQGPDLPFLKTALERSRKLYADGLIAPSLLEDADKAYQLGLNKQTAAKSQAAVSKAEVEKARAALERYETDLRYATITSPMDGLVLSRDVEVGDAVSSILVLGSQATLVMTLGDVSEVYVLGKVDEADIGKVFLGQRARIVVESFKDKSFDGKVTKISPLGKEKDNVTTFEVRVSIRNPGGELKTNMTANAEIILEEKKGVLIVPESAIVYDKDRKPSLEVPDPKAEGGKRKVAVELGISNGVKTEVVEGLKEGDQVVLQ